MPSARKTFTHPHTKRQRDDSVSVRAIFSAPRVKHDVSNIYSMYNRVTIHLPPSTQCAPISFSSFDLDDGQVICFSFSCSLHSTTFTEQSWQLPPRTAKAEARVRTLFSRDFSSPELLTTQFGPRSMSDITVDIRCLQRSSHSTNLRTKIQKSTCQVVLLPWSMLHLLPNLPWTLYFWVELR